MNPSRIIVHHSATKDGATFSWRAIRYYHMNWAVDGTTVSEATARLAIDEGGHSIKPPFDDVGYQAGGELLGDEYECIYGRPDHISGAHARGHNQDSLGFCFVGNYDLVAPDIKSIQVAAQRVLAPWCRLYGIGLDQIIGHREVSSKTCPGALFDMVALRDEIARELK